VIPRRGLRRTAATPVPARALDRRSGEAEGRGKRQWSAEVSSVGTLSPQFEAGRSSAGWPAFKRNSIRRPMSADNPFEAALRNYMPAADNFAREGDDVVDPELEAAWRAWQISHPDFADETFPSGDDHFAAHLRAWARTQREMARHFLEAPAREHAAVEAAVEQARRAAARAAEMAQARERAARAEAAALEQARQEAARAALAAEAAQHDEERASEAFRAQLQRQFEPRRPDETRLAYRIRSGDIDGDG